MLATAIALITATATAQERQFHAAFNDEALKRHNLYRGRHHAPPLERDAALARGAERYAAELLERGVLEHSGGAWGENLYASAGQEMDGAALAAAAVSSWYGESKQYRYNRPRFSPATGHFTQVVWKATLRVGCGAAGRDTRYVVVCRYSPPGNVIGRFRENVLRP